MLNEITPKLAASAEIAIQDLLRLPDAPAEGGLAEPVVVVGGEGLAEDTPGVLWASCLEEAALQVTTTAKSRALGKS